MKSLRVASALGLVPALFLFAAQGCRTSGVYQASEGPGERPGPSSVRDQRDRAPQAITAPIGESCSSGDPNKLCLAIRYVAYQNGGGDPTVSESEAIENIRKVNRVWEACEIQFQIDEYIPVAPGDYDLKYRTANSSELSAIRRAFASARALLVTTTGAWDRAGTLGRTGANAWTSMPGAGPFGVVMEEPVATYSNIIGHELGHYLNLGHTSDKANLMNPIIYTSSTKIYQSQCTEARSAAAFFWKRMLR